MKAIFLAAGQGNRLKPLTDEIPKCMVPFQGKPLLTYGVETMREAGIDKIVVVRGYRSEKINLKRVKFVENIKFATTNMVFSLFCARDELDDDLVVSYSDIVYGRKAVRSLMECPGEIAVVIDKDWKALWSLRMRNPLDDAETLKLDSEGCVVELGKKAFSYQEIEGQYTGLIKFKRSILPDIMKFYDSLDKNARYDGQSFEGMYMTSFLQLLVDAGYKIKAALIHGGWLEIDSLEDLEAYRNSGPWTFE